MHSRHAVIFPWGSPPAADAPGKELYLVPLQPSQTPEYLEMLDHLALPTPRTETVLVGIFILLRRRPAVLPPSMPPPPSIPSAPIPPPSAVPSIPGLSTLGFDLSTFTPEFIAELLKTNPAISAAATAAFASPPSGAAYLPADPYAQPGPSSSSYAPNAPTGYGGHGMPYEDQSRNHGYR